MSLHIDTGLKSLPPLGSGLINCLPEANLDAASTYREDSPIRFCNGFRSGLLGGQRLGETNSGVTGRRYSTGGRQ